MNKWLARLEALELKSSGAPSPPDCQNRQKGLLSVLAGGREEADEKFQAAAGRGDQARYLARVDRLRRWGWPAADAEAKAERLARRDAEEDDRVMCAADCRHYRRGQCGNHKAAGLTTSEVGPDLAGLLQRCPGVQREI